MGRRSTKAVLKPTIERMLDASTVTINAMDAELLADAGARFGDHENPVIAYPKGDYGWFIWVPGPGLGEEDLAGRDQEMRGYGYTVDFLALVHHARDIGCGWIMLDQDGGNVPGLDPGERVKPKP